MPNTLNVIQPNLRYSLIVGVSERVRYGRLILVMGKKFCTDSAGNQFTRTENSSLFIHFGEFDSESFLLFCSIVFLFPKWFWYNYVSLFNIVVS